jgi:cysteine desulfurase
MQPIYLDHSASTPVDPRVIDAMLPYFGEKYGNPASAHHQGRLSQQGLTAARRTIADLLNARPDEIVFTGCGSESDNIALRGVMWAAQAAGRGNHLITCITEHKAVLDTAKQLRDHFGCALTILGVNDLGEINLAELEAAIRPETVLISIMAANNEIGTLHPYQKIGEIAHAHGILYHTDAVQGATTLPLDMATMPIDLMSIAPHKFYGPKGVGILYARRDLELISPITGGNQENGRRAGTVNVAFAVAAAEALRLAYTEQDTYVDHYRRLRDQLINGILTAVPPELCRLTGHPEKRLAHHASFAFRGINGNDLLIQLDMAGIGGSSGSACSTGNPKPSAILEALGLNEEWTTGGLRLTVGRQNTIEEIAYVVEKVPQAVEALQTFSRQFA